MLEAVEPVKQILAIGLAYLYICLRKREVHYYARFFDSIDEIKIYDIHLMYLHEVRALRYNNIRCCGATQRHRTTIIKKSFPNLTSCLKTKISDVVNTYKFLVVYGIYKQDTLF